MLCNLFVFVFCNLFVLNIIDCCGWVRTAKKNKKKKSSENTLNGGTLSSAKWCCDFVDGEQRTVLVRCTKVKAFICLAVLHILSAIEIVDLSLIII